MVKLLQTNIGGKVFKFQAGFSYVQQNEFLRILERFICFKKLRAFKKDVKKVSLEDISTVLKDDVSLLDFNYEMSRYLLLNIVDDPEITDEDLEDPDNPDNENYYLLGIELAKSAMPYLGRLMNLKKTLKI